MWCEYFFNFLFNSLNFQQRDVQLCGQYFIEDYFPYRFQEMSVKNVFRNAFYSASFYSTYLNLFSSSKEHQQQQLQIQTLVALFPSAHIFCLFFDLSFDWHGDREIKCNIDKFFLSFHLEDSIFVDYIL